MNIIEAMRTLADDVDLVDAASYIEEAAIFVHCTLGQFDALAPTPEMWSQAPDWARWYTVDRENYSWWENEPSPGNGARWTVLSTPHGRWDCVWSRRPVITPGIDWRLCKWQRPEVTG